jgi:translation elongation factor EF-1alpha
MENQRRLIGKIIHVFGKINVAVVNVLESFSIGDRIIVTGGGKEFSQIVSSIEKNHQKITRAEKGDMVGLEMAEKVKKGYLIYKEEQ